MIFSFSQLVYTIFLIINLLPNDYICKENTPSQKFYVKFSKTLVIVNTKTNLQKSTTSKIVARISDCNQFIQKVLSVKNMNPLERYSLNIRERMMTYMLFYKDKKH